MSTLKTRAKAIKIIFFDIDDTLRDPQTGFMPNSITRVFARLREKGIMTGIATGRSYVGVVDEIKALNPDYFVTINGAYAVDSQGQVIYSKPLDKLQIEQVLAWGTQQQIDLAFVGHDDIKVTHWGRLAQEAITPIYGQLGVDPTFYRDHAVYQMLTISDASNLELPVPLQSELRLVPWHAYSADIVPRTGSKAVGVSKVLAHLGLKAEQMMNFGDGLNDRELFEFSGIGVAMKDAHPDIHQRADYITDDIAHDGILKALEELEIL